MKKTYLIVAAALFVVLGMAGCATGLLAWWLGWIPGRGQALVAPGPVAAETATFQMAVYFLPTPAGDPQASLDRLLAGDFAAFKKVATEPNGRDALQVRATINDDVQKSYRPPSLEALEYSGEGLSPEQSAAVQQSKTALVLDFAAPRERVWEANRLAGRLMAVLAREHAGLVWDEETREVYTPDALEADRLEAWTETLPDVSTHIVIHAYQAGEYVRVVSLGMEKFGLPDLVVENTVWSSQRNVGHIINLCAQAMAEGAVVGKGGELKLRLADIANADVREPQLAALGKDAKAEIVLVLRQAVRDEGDADNRLFEIGFDRQAGTDVYSRVENALAEFFGSEDAIHYVDHSDEILAASKRARARLPALRRAFNAGLKPGEYVLLKAPFETTSGGSEWMWVEVTSWRRGKITGSLQNTPFDVPSLKSGQKVEVREDDVFDYIRHRADGTTEGNETGPLLQAQSESSQKR